MLTSTLAFGRNVTVYRANRMRRSQIALASTFAPQVVQAFGRFGAVTGGKPVIALDILAKWPENEPPEPVYGRRVVASTSQDNKVDSGDDK